MNFEFNKKENYNEIILNQSKDYVKFKKEADKNIMKMKQEATKLAINITEDTKERMKKEMLNHINISELTMLSKRNLLNKVFSPKFYDRDLTVYDYKISYSYNYSICFSLEEFQKAKKIFKIIEF